MNLLAFDMSMHACSVALMQGDHLVSTVDLAVRQQSRHVLSMIKNLLYDAGISFSQLDGIAFGCGPGSFTGVRLSASIAQGIAFSENLPVLPVSSMKALAQGICGDLNVKTAYIALNAYAGDIYIGAYEKTTQPIVQVVVAERRCLPQELSFDDIDTQSCVVAGDGWQAYSEILKNKLPAEVQLQCDYVLHAKEILAIAKVDFEQGGGVAPELALPAYLHREDMWKKVTI